jgi:hypothetical protein
MSQNPNLLKNNNKIGYKVTNLKFDTEYSMTFSINSITIWQTYLWLSCLDKLALILAWSNDKWSETMFILASFNDHYVSFQNLSIRGSLHSNNHTKTCTKW